MVQWQKLGNIQKRRNKTEVTMALGERGIGREAKNKKIIKQRTGGDCEELG